MGGMILDNLGQNTQRSNPAWSPGYNAYRNALTETFESPFGPDSITRNFEGKTWFKEDPLSWDQWRALQAGLGVSNPVTPTTPPVPSDALQGLLKQSADPFGTYGQLGVNEPYLSNINNRFGWSPQGLAYPTQLQASPSWYNPPIIYPDVVQPPLTKSSSGSSTR